MFLPLKCFPWPPSHLPEKGDYLLFCCGPVFILVSLCLFCCVMALLCHPPTRPWFPLSFFIYLLIGGKLLYIVVLVSLSSLPWHARGGGSDWKVQHLLCLHYSPQGRCCSEGFTFTIKSSFDSHSDPVKVRPFL